MKSWNIFTVYLRIDVDSVVIGLWRKRENRNAIRSKLSSVVSTRSMQIALSVWMHYSFGIYQDIWFSTRIFAVLKTDLESFIGSFCRNTGGSRSQTTFFPFIQKLLTTLRCYLKFNELLNNIAKLVRFCCFFYSSLKMRWELIFLNPKPLEEYDYKNQNTVAFTYLD